MPSIKTWTCWCVSTGVHEDDQRAAAPILQRQAEKLVKPGEDSGNMTTGNGYKTKEGDLDQILGVNSLLRMQ